MTTKTRRQTIETIRVVQLGHGPLFCTDGIYIKEQCSPVGWHVARHDHEGFVCEGARWFPTLDKAMGYAEGLRS